MSYFLLPVGSDHIIGVRYGLVKKQDREAFTAAASLLRRASELAGEKDAALTAERTAAWAEGYAAGTAKAEAELGQELLRFTSAIADIAELHTRNVAEAAYAATVAIIGEFDDAALVGRLVKQVIAQQKDASGIHILVHPDIHARLAASMDDESAVPISSAPNLNATDCHVVTANGRIIASLPVQLAVLRERWGIDAEAAGA